MSPLRIGKAQYESLADMRFALRTFLRFSQGAAREAGLTVQQHQALLVLKGFPGRDFVFVTELAERLQVRHHSAVGLVDRLVQRQLLRRKPSATDRRRVELHLTRQGERVIERLSVIHLRELRQFGPSLQRLLGSLRRT